ncbi:hypothetical protein [Bradyrhizobium sp. CCBAU 25338]|uniref:hypothetical protein n=1 Tax=Bradyrhizobium sp. CCBAU 25338 TaxID=1641877 RepID=UPI002303E131|nr:hypothetical protein [Bradyrhizobium sp. CCBAU 25338]
MIITISKHGRTRRDGAQLVQHLLKPENEAIEVLEIGNCAATDIEGVIRDMELLRDSSKATAGFHHLSISPRRDCTKDELRACANRTRLELDPEGERAYVIIRHVKKRATPDAAPSHAHLVLANVLAPTDSAAVGRALKDGRSKIRTEAIARICEYELGEFPPTLGRHHKSVLKILDERGLTHIRRWLVDALGEGPERPRSAMSPQTRQRAKRQGVNLPVAKATVAALWSVTGNAASFQTALQGNGFELVPGNRRNVWVVRDGEGHLIGAADRLLGIKRHEFRHLMENPNEPAAKRTQPGPAPADGRARQEAVRSVESNRRSARPIEPTLGPVGARSFECGSRPDLSDIEIPRSLGGSLAAPDRLAPGDRFEIGIPSRKFEYWRSMILLRGLGRGLARSTTIAEFMKKDPPPQIREERWDIWGVPIPPPKYHP